MENVDDELEDIEITALLETVHKRYGYDFRQYSRESLKRRIHTLMDRNSVSTVSELVVQPEKRLTRWLYSYRKRGYTTVRLFMPLT